MLRPGATKLPPPARLLPILGIQPRKDAMLLALLIAATSAAMVLGIGLQIAPAVQADSSRAREIEALVDRIREASCVSGQAGQDRQQRQAQSDARSASWQR